ncbi:carboxymuconolactone decarboxylase family protein [Clostridium brassicae]|uniref:Carboxymuconolactone decarboxylase family protein n=1 Tax=Clostridium brassicae TaxID=2999072 RepID=A0ABT4D8T3_9CLOT|nr:carboxymuconolactone decarboxylase family protein [Clostridium brassicae]MCY6957439.1 carboxymuconolactone decarboxylase family protein [Clostridium brassicae]
MNKPLVSNAFQTFMNEAPEHAKVWMEVVQKLGNVSGLDKKTEELAYIAVLAATRMESGIPFHVKQAKEKGASREEIISAILVGLPAVGNIVTTSLPIALESYDNK